jgi:hypothetical protein
MINFNPLFPGDLTLALPIPPLPPKCCGCMGGFLIPTSTLRERE